MTTLRRQMKNMVKNYSEAEVKVREATSNDPWGPSSTLMSEISDLTYNIVALGEIMRMIWKRLNDHGKNWRHVYKSLVLLDYLIKNGNEKVAQQCKEHIVAIQTLKDFQYLEEQKDQGASVREKAKQLVNLLRDDERLKAERAKAFKARERFAQNAMGISSDNKMVFASRAMGQNRPNSSYADPYGGASTSAAGAVGGGGGASGLAPELEAVRPSDQTEEELQLKLAIMLSQQEHEEEVQRKRADEAKLAIALEQSKNEGQPNGLVDIGGDDPWGDSNSGSSSLQHTSDPFAASMPGPPALESVNGGDPWLPPPPNASGKHHHHHNNHNDPWATNGSSSSSNSASATNPWSSSGGGGGATASAQDDFDLFTSNRKASIGGGGETTTHHTAATTKTQQLDDPFGDFFGGTGGATASSTSGSKPSTNPWNDTTTTSSSAKIDPFATSNDFDLKPVTSSTSAATNKTSGGGMNPTRKTPESFLGENSALVNLENLIPTRPKSTNPFGSTAVGGAGVTSASVAQSSSMTTSTSHGHLNNPFAAQQAQQALNRPTINQLQQQSMFPSFGHAATTPSTTTPTLLQPSLTGGGLAQPLIVAPSTQTPYMQATASTTTTTSAATPNLFPQLGGFGLGPSPFGNMATTTPAASNTPAAAASTNPFLMM